VKFDILGKLRTQDSVLAVLVLALLAQMPHAQHVFYGLSQDLGWFGWVQSWFAAVALEFAVLVFVVRGKTLESWGFAAFSIAINLIYYYVPEVALWMPRATWLLSAGLPVAIALYSHEVAGKVIDTEVDADSNQNPTTEEMQPDVNQPVDIVLPDVNSKLTSVALAVETVDIARRADQLLGEYGNDRGTVCQLLNSEGYKGVDIALTLGVNKSQVSRWLKKESKQDEN
jgi:hypothetical protein